jgi:hypothetical protein
MTNNPAQEDYDRPDLASQLSSHVIVLLTGRDGVSFAGFYYISFNQETGAIHGMYFAENSEQYTFSIF